MSDALFLAGLAVLAVVASWGSTVAVRRYALAVDLLDHPNDRSSHTVPTPRGGGVAFVACFLLLSMLLWKRGFIGTSQIAAIS